MTLPAPSTPTRINRRFLYAVVAVITLLVAAEAIRGAVFVLDLRAAKSQLLSLKNDLDISRLQQSEAEVLARQAKLRDARDRTGRARGFVRTDPLLAVSRLLPVAGKQASGLSNLVYAADEATATGLEATDVALAFARYERDTTRTSIQDALAFLEAQQEPMAAVDAGLQRLKARRDRIGDGLYGPLSNAKSELSSAIEKLDGLVTGYKRADALLPQLLGYDGRKRYLVLPQNDTELFPSGGLISSYGIATFEGGKLVSMDLEYFGTLYDRWQAQTREYVEPPGPLKNYLKHNYSWGLGEAGWYPDFPTTSELARSFVARGGAPATDGVIAIDLQFISELLKVLGPIAVPEYGVTVNAENVPELTLEQTRDETYAPGQPKKAFLSFMAKAVLNRVFTAPKDQWVSLLHLLDRMGRERHLQLNFTDPGMQALSREYGFDGAIDPEAGESDFLLIADTSVNSTKLNLILETKARLDIELRSEGWARTLLNYEVGNPFPEWQKVRDPRMVKALMLEGYYGSYLRLYTRPDAVLRDVRVQNQPAGAEQNGVELDKRVFGRFFVVPPGGANTAEFVYYTPGVVRQTGRDRYAYELYLQKEAGTEALPLRIRLLLPTGAKADSVTIDGKEVEGTDFTTDLRTDRFLHVSFVME